MLLLKDWTEEERNEIDRLAAKCREIDGYELECSHAEVGKPWCIVRDALGEQLIHITRIEHYYVVGFPVLGTFIKRRTMETAVNLAIHELSVRH